MHNKSGSEGGYSNGSEGHSGKSQKVGVRHIGEIVKGYFFVKVAFIGVSAGVFAVFQLNELTRKGVGLSVLEIVIFVPAVSQEESDVSVFEHVILRGVAGVDKS